MIFCSKLPLFLKLVTNKESNFVVVCLCIIILISGCGRSSKYTLHTVRYVMNDYHNNNIIMFLSYNNCTNQLAIMSGYLSIVYVVFTLPLYYR